MSNHQDDIERGQRFAFGKNWADFSNVLNEQRITKAEESLRTMLNVETLDGLSFLDIGCGSGLFSLAAHRLGARVHSFDFDPQSVATTQELRRRFGMHSKDWKIEEASILDTSYLSTLGSFDIVYSWGVLHHTGHMWQALTNTITAIAPNGKLFIAIYNNQGAKSKVWHLIKQIYCSGHIGKTIISSIFFPVFAATGLIQDICRIKNPTQRYREYHNKRGMSLYHDWIDWLGGYPYETATPSEIERFCSERGLCLERQNLTNTLGCNEFLFHNSIN